MEEQNPPETLQSLLKQGYELDQLAWARISGPRAGTGYLRDSGFENIADVDFEFDDERVIEYGQRYDDEKLGHILEIMPGAIQLPVDQKCLLCNHQQRCQLYN
ncbi:hypothetical protein Glove_151g142 [Diversispora epigaea]|uniref:Uncharacterized protein n=1 Tax=Diversispora epigaea TaxID=1348612 RepID=A0A397ISX2_9GLOM|nr:hypothetical protein Glove_151g142 [Diversispora epigaea]